MIQFHYTLV